MCLERGADLHIAQLMLLPLTVSSFSEIQIGFTFLVPAHSGSPRRRAVKRVCVCVCLSRCPSSFRPLLRLRVAVGGRRGRRRRSDGPGGGRRSLPASVRAPCLLVRQPGRSAGAVRDPGRRPAGRQCRHVRAECSTDRQRIARLAAGHTQDRPDTAARQFSRFLPPPRDALIAQ